MFPFKSVARAFIWDKGASVARATSPGNVQLAPASVVMTLSLLICASRAVQHAAALTRVIRVLRIPIRISIKVAYRRWNFQWGIAMLEKNGRRTNDGIHP